MPVLVYGSKYYRVAVPAMMAKYKEYCAEAKFIIFEGPRHNPQVEEPWKLFPAIKNFLHK